MMGTFPQGYVQYLYNVPHRSRYTPWTLLAPGEEPPPDLTSTSRCKEDDEEMHQRKRPRKIAARKVFPSSSKTNKENKNSRTALKAATKKAKEEAVIAAERKILGESAKTKSETSKVNGSARGLPVEDLAGDTPGNQTVKFTLRLPGETLDAVQSDKLSFRLKPDIKPGDLVVIPRTNERLTYGKVVKLFKASGNIRVNVDPNKMTTCKTLPPCLVGMIHSNQDKESIRGLRDVVKNNILGIEDIYSHMKAKEDKTGYEIEQCLFVAVWQARKMFQNCDAMQVEEGVEDGWGVGRERKASKMIEAAEEKRRQSEEKSKKLEKALKARDQELKVLRSQLNDKSLEATQYKHQVYDLREFNGVYQQDFTKTRKENSRLRKQTQKLKQQIAALKGEVSRLEKAAEWLNETEVSGSRTLDESSIVSIDSNDDDDNDSDESSEPTDPRLSRREE
eukprot:jgi/Bigna1/131708/aug1.15_g6416